MKKHFPASQGLLNAIYAAILCLLGAGPAAGDPDCIAEGEACCCVGTVGNVDCDFRDIVDVGDLTWLINYLYITPTALPNQAEANVDGDLYGIIDIGDLTRLIDYLYLTNQPLPPCAVPITFNAPPRTEIREITDTPFINALVPGNPAAGISLLWTGFDKVDHPYYPPPFEFEWRLYGPYYENFKDTLADSTWDRIRDDFVKTVFVTRDGQVFHLGDGDKIVDCDTFFADSSGVIVQRVQCDTMLIDTITSANIYGLLDTIFDINSPAFVSNPLFNRIAAESYDLSDFDEWVYDTSAVLYDVFHLEPSDTTQQQYFIFWIRSRDPVDSTLFDPTPDFVSFSVINPKYERDIGILDAQYSFSINGRVKDSARAYWGQAIPSWAASAGLTINYDPGTDYICGTCGSSTLDLRRLLKYKLLVIVNDDALSGLMTYTPFSTGPLPRAMDAGVNVWLCGRAQIYGPEGGGPVFDLFAGAEVPTTLQDVYQDYFAVTNMAFSGWTGHWYGVVPGVPAGTHIEDFIGAASAGEAGWPDLDIDTTLLHSRYYWSLIPWVDTIAALPEVDYVSLSAEAETLYTYKSLYGGSHPLGAEYSFEGNVVMHRFQQPFFRTVHSLFTPYAFDPDTVQVIVDSVLSWLYDPGLTAPPQSKRYMDGRTDASVQGLRVKPGPLSPPPERRR
jgi:hypothetical protein